MIELNGILEVFFGGILGSLLVEAVKLIAWRDRATIDEKYRRPLYWLLTGLLWIVSGTVCVLNGIDHVPILKAVQLGINAPAIVGAFATGSVTRTRLRAPRTTRGFIDATAEGDVPSPSVPQALRLLSW